MHVGGLQCTRINMLAFDLIYQGAGKRPAAQLKK